MTQIQKKQLCQINKQNSEVRLRRVTKKLLNDTIRYDRIVSPELLSLPSSSFPNHFYRAMHFSAKRGIAIACRLSVCLSVRNVEVL